MVQLNGIAMIGVLPPLTGLSYYCLSLVNSLAKYTKINFISFRSLYPKIIHTGTRKIDFNMKIHKNVNTKKVLTYYNPISWLKIGIFTRERIIHMQLWSLPVIPILIFISFIFRLRNKKLILTMHNIKYFKCNWLYIFLARILLSFIDVVILHTNFNKSEFLKLYNFKRRIEVIPHGIFDFYNLNISKSEAKRRLGIKNKIRIILNFGLVKNYKGIDDLIRAFYDVKKKINDVKLIIAGELWVNWKPYDNLIKDLRLEKDIILDLSYISNEMVSYYMAASDLVVLPYNSKYSAQSGVGTVVLFFKKPLIVSDVGGLPELVRSNVSVVPRENPSILGRRIIYILKNKAVMRRLISDSIYLNKIYSWRNLAVRYINLYRDLSE